MFLIASFPFEIAPNFVLGGFAKECLIVFHYFHKPVAFILLSHHHAEFVVHPENRFDVFHSQLSLGFSSAEFFLGNGDEDNGNYPSPDWQTTVLHFCTAPNTGPESTGSTREEKLVFNPKMLDSSTLLSDYLLLDLLSIAEFNTGGLVWKPIMKLIIFMTKTIYFP